MLQFSHRFPLLFVLLLLLGSGAASAAQKETRWYDVEVIIFAQTSQSYRDSEVWPLDYTQPDMADARDLVQMPDGNPDPAKPVAFRQLNPDELKLNDDADRVDKASDLELLTHFGWRQPGLPDDKAVAVRVSIPAKETTDSETSGAAGATQVQQGDNSGIMQPATPPRLEGTLKLILSRYLHIDTDLLYREPLEGEEAKANQGRALPITPDGGNEATTPAQQPDLFMLAEHAKDNQPLYRVYRMQQSRRMRSGELHYLDHPVFGLAVLVTPYEPPAEAQDDATAAQ